MPPVPQLECARCGAVLEQRTVAADDGVRYWIAVQPCKFCLARAVDTARRRDQRRWLGRMFDLALRGRG